jgi:hypothetical protein
VKQTRFLEGFAFIVIAVVLCCGYMTGSDWRYYELEYYNSYNINLVEPLYKLLNNFFSHIGIGFWPFFILLKVFLLFLLFRVYKHFEIPLFFCVMIFIPILGLPLFVDNPMRNLMAYVIFAYFVRYIDSREFSKYLIGITLAFLAHRTAIILLPLYFLYNVKINKKILFGLYLLLCVLLSSSKIIFLVLDICSQISVLGLGEKIQTYVNDIQSNPMSIHLQFRLFSWGLAIRILIFLVLLYFKERIQASFKYGKLLYFLFICYMFFDRIALAVNILMRLAIYFKIFFVCLAGYLLMTLSEKNQRIMKIVVCIGCIFWTIDVVTGTWKYIPYTNYINYTIKGNFPLYEERSDYNFRYTPYGYLEDETYFQWTWKQNRKKTIRQTIYDDFYSEKPDTLYNFKSQNVD